MAHPLQKPQRVGRPRKKNKVKIVSASLGCPTRHLHFITFSCYRRLPLMKTVRAWDIFVKELGKVRDEMGFHLLGYVVMPEHVHLLMSEPKRGTPSTVLQKLKLRVPRKLRKRARPVCARQIRLPFAQTGEPLRAFWQARFYDFNVYSKGK
ncbi:MAG: transposase [Candidatus Acidiferrum sp.]